MKNRYMRFDVCGAGKVLTMFGWAFRSDCPGGCESGKHTGTLSLSVSPSSYNAVVEDFRWQKA